MTDHDIYGDGDDGLDPDLNATPPILDPDDPDWMAQATYRLRLINKLECQQADIARVYQQEINRLQDRMDDQIARLEQRIDWHRRPLIQFHQRVLEQDPSRKTITLPNGRLSSRTSHRPKFAVADNDTFTAWAFVNAPHLLRITTKPAASEIQKAGLLPDGPPSVGAEVKVVNPETGEMVPGLVAFLTPPAFDVLAGDDL
jgi:hypothetical protein